jgi:hypothetical protein
LLPPKAATEKIVGDRQRRFQQLHSGRLAQLADEAKTELRSINETGRRRIEIHDQEARAARQVFQAGLAAERRDLPGSIRAETLASDARIIETSAGRVEKATARAARGLSDLRRGFRGARDGAKEFEGEAFKAQRAAAQIGAEAGKATRGVSNFINLRWLLVIGLVQSLLTVVAQLAAALVAVASSAVLAAGALGGALIAGISQALPVVGLLAAAFYELQNAMKVVQLRQQANQSRANDQATQLKEQKAAVQSLADAHYSLQQALQQTQDAQRGIRDAHQRVADAIKEQRDAIKGLADAEQQAKRKIVDAAFDERDSALALQEAELGVLDAKRRLADFENAQRLNKQNLADAQAAVREAQDRLALAKQQGDAVEIAQAAASLATARSNVTTIQDQINSVGNQQKDLQTGIKRAQLTEEEARVRRRRAIQDDSRIRAQGVEGSPEVIAARERIRNANRQYRDSIQGVADAQRAYKDSLHGVAQAQRSIADSQDAVTAASSKMTAAEKNARREFLRLDPVERQFVLAIERFKNHWKTAMRPITDIIISGVTRALNRVSTLLQDPEIHKNLLILATQIGKVADHFSKWVISPEGRRFLNQFIKNAAENLPVIADAAGNFAKALANIALAAAPIFAGLVGGIDRVSKRFDAFTGKTRGKLSPGDAFHHRETEKATSALEKFFGIADKHLKSWIDLTRAIGNFLGALIGAASGPGLDMVEGMAKAFDHLAESIRKNPEEIRKFFDRVRDSLGTLLPLLGKFFIDLLKAVTSKEFNDFTKFVIQVMIPALVNLMTILGLVAGVLTFFTNLPVVGPLAKIVIEFALITAALVKLFPVLRVVATAFRTMGRGTIIAIVVGAMIVLYRHLGFLEDKFGRLGHWIRIVATLFGGLFVAKLLGARGALASTAKAITEDMIGSLKNLVTWLGRSAAAAGTKLVGALKGLGRSLVTSSKAIAEQLIVQLRNLVIQAGRAAAAVGTKLVGALRGLRGTIAGGGTAGGGGLAGMIGKAGLAAAVGVLAYESTKAILHITGLDKKLAAFGARAFDLVSKSKTGRKIAGFLTGADLSNVDRANQVDELEARYGRANLAAAMNEFRDLEHRKHFSPTAALFRAARDHRIPPADLATYMPPSFRPPGYKEGGKIEGKKEGSPVSAIVHVGEWVLNKAQQLKLSSMIQMPVGKIKDALFGKKVNRTAHFADGGVVGGDRLARMKSLVDMSLTASPGQTHYIASQLKALRLTSREKQFVQKYSAATGDALMQKTNPWNAAVAQAVSFGMNPRAFVHPLRRLEGKGEFKATDVIGRDKNGKPILGYASTLPWFGGSERAAIDAASAAKTAGPISSGLKAFARGYFKYYHNPQLNFIDNIFGPLFERFIGGLRTSGRRFIGDPFARVIGKQPGQAGEEFSRRMSKILRPLGFPTPLHHHDEFLDQIHKNAAIRRGLNEPTQWAPKDETALKRFLRDQRGELDVTAFRGRPFGGARRPRIEKFVEGREWRPPPKPRGKTIKDDSQTVARGSVGERIVASMTGGKIVSGTGTGRGGTGAFDVSVGRARDPKTYIETKTFSADGSEYNPTRKESQILAKQKFLRENGGTARVAYVVVDPKSGRAYVYSRPGLEYGRLGKDGTNRGWTYHGYKVLSEGDLRNFRPNASRLTSAAGVAARERFAPGSIVRLTDEDIKGTPQFARTGGFPDRIPAVYDEMDQVLIVGKHNWQHEAIRSALRNLRPQMSNRHLQEIAYHARDDRWPAPARWRVYDHDSAVSNREIDMLQRVKNAAIYASGNVPVAKKKTLGQIARERRGYQDGGVIGKENTRAGQAIAITAHVGEWVLNKAQQIKMARRLGITLEQAKMMLFGTKGIEPDHSRPKNVTPGTHVDLVGQDDSYGTTIWFVRMQDGTYGQVSARDARRIQASKGTWVPGYASRAARIYNPAKGAGMLRAFANGGVVSYAAPGTNSFAAGGVVSGPKLNTPERKGNTVQQHFEVKTEGESDWEYIMRLGAQHAQAAY